jgi:hypothetical protein
MIPPDIVAALAADRRRHLESQAAAFRAAAAARRLKPLTPHEKPRERLTVEAQAETTANPHTVWALVKDANTYSDWGPWCASGDKNPGARPSGDVGTVRWLGYQRTTTVELVTEVEPGRRMAYTVLRGIPVRNYRADVTLTPTDTGTHIEWRAEWDRTLAGRIVHRKLRTLYPVIVACLAAAAERGSDFEHAGTIHALPSQPADQNARAVA